MNSKNISITEQKKLIDNFIEGAKTVKNPFQQYDILAEGLLKVENQKQQYYEKAKSLKQIAELRMTNTSYAEDVAKTVNRIGESHFKSPISFFETSLYKFPRIGRPSYLTDYNPPYPHYKNGYKPRIRPKIRIVPRR